MGTPLRSRIVRIGRQHLSVSATGLRRAVARRSYFIHLASRMVGSRSLARLGQNTLKVELLRMLVGPLSRCAAGFLRRAVFCSNLSGAIFIAVKYVLGKVDWNLRPGVN